MKAGQAADRAPSPWQSIKANATTGARDLQDRIDRKRHDLDAKSAERGAEENALDALGFARWAVKQAEVAVLDAVDTRARADERAAASQTN